MLDRTNSTTAFRVEARASRRHVCIVRCWWFREEGGRGALAHDGRAFEHDWDESCAGVVAVGGDVCWV